MIDLFIEKYRADIRDDVSALLTYAIDDVKTFGSRNTAYSKTIVLPGTARNNALFGNIFDFNSANFYDSTKANINYNFNAAKSARCIMFQDNIQVFKGIVRLLKIIVDRNYTEYEISVFGELGGLSAALGAKKLEDLDFSSYNHPFNADMISGSWDNIKGSGFYYPLIDYAGMSTDKKNWDIRTFRPALYVKEYFTKIFNAAGYKLLSSVMDTNRFRSLVVTSTRKESTTTYVTHCFDGDFDWTQPTIQLSPTEQQIKLNPVPRSSALDMLQDNSGLKWSHGAGFSTAHSIKVWFQIIANDPNGNIVLPVTITLKLRINGLVKQTAQWVVGPPMNTNSHSLTFAITLTSVQLINDGDVFSVSYDVQQSGNFVTFTSGSWTIDNTPAFQFGGIIGSTVNMNGSIPKNILQIDFLSSIAQMFNLLIYESPTQDKMLLIEPYVNFYDIGGGQRLLQIDNSPDILDIDGLGNGLLLDDGNQNIRDWSLKLDRSQPIEIMPMSEINSRYYYFQYKHDSDYWNEFYFNKWNENYGDYRFDTQIDFSSETQNVELIFASTPLRRYDGDDKTIPAIYKLNGVFGAAGTTETPFDGAIRILQAKKIACASWSIKDGVNVLKSITAYGYAGHFDDPGLPGADLNFGATRELYYPGTSTPANQFNVYWSPYMAEIIDKDSRLLRATFRLTTKDINELDFSKFIYIDGSLFRLNKIEDYNVTAEDTCKVTLLKVIQPTY